MPTPFSDVIFKKNLNLKIFCSRHQVALESLNYDHSTQNRKSHQAVVTDYFLKNPIMNFTSSNKLLYRREFKHYIFKIS